LVRPPYPCRRGSLPLGVALALGLAEILMCSSGSRRSGISMDRGLWKMGRGRASGHFRSSGCPGTMARRCRDLQYDEILPAEKDPRRPWLGDTPKLPRQ
jgi:hypothetical protein